MAKPPAATSSMTSSHIPYPLLHTLLPCSLHNAGEGSLEMSFFLTLNAFCR
jgi:hypothetical protein